MVSFNKVKSWYKHDPVRLFFILSTCFIHIIFLLLVVFSPAISLKKKEHKITVKTFYAPKPEAKVIQKRAPTPRTPTPQSAVKSTSKDTNMPVAKPLKEPIKKEIAKPVDQATKPTTKGPTQNKSTEKGKEKSAPIQQKQKEEPIPQNLLDELEQKIANLQSPKNYSQPSSSHLSSSKVTLPAKVEISDLKLEESSEDTQSYIEMLISFLHQNLHLPDFGEVKMEITIGKTGTIQKCVVISSESEKNKKYLQQNIPMLRMPAILSKGKHSSEQTFVLTFCNKL